MKLNLVNQLLAGKILISKSLGVKDGKFRLPPAPWKPSAFFVVWRKDRCHIGLWKLLALTGGFEGRINAALKGRSSTVALPPSLHHRRSFTLESNVSGLPTDLE